VVPVVRLLVGKYIRAENDVYYESLGLNIATGS
jgi:hypothetical protein